LPESDGFDRFKLTSMTERDRNALFDVLRRNVGGATGTDGDERMAQVLHTVRVVYACNTYAFFKDVPLHVYYRTGYRAVWHAPARHVLEANFVFAGVTDEGDRAILKATGNYYEHPVPVATLSGYIDQMVRNAKTFPREALPPVAFDLTAGGSGSERELEDDSTAGGANRKLRVYQGDALAMEGMAMEELDRMVSSLCFRGFEATRTSVARAAFRRGIKVLWEEQPPQAL
jgi:hypothetical protein